MARKSRSPITSPSQRDTTPIARSAAGSRSLSYWTDLPQSRPAVSRPASVVQRTKRHPLVAQAPLKRPSRPFSFGAWSPPPPIPSQQTLSSALSCARRGIRREVLFAKKFTGAGSHSRKKYYSNRRCK